MIFISFMLNQCAEAVQRNLSFIERICRKAVCTPRDAARGQALEIGRENDADELFIAVLDHLKQDDFRAIREFRGQSDIKTYLTTIISRLHIDRIIQRQGKNRQKERAREFGRVGELVHEFVFKRGDYTPEAARELLERDYGEKISADRFEEIVAAIAGKGRPVPAETVTIAYEFTDDSGGHGVTETPEPVPVAGREYDPEETFTRGQRCDLAARVLNEFTAQLTGEERLLFSLRHPVDDEQGSMTFKEIADVLQSTPKRTEHLYYRALARFRENLLARGIALDDFLQP